VQSFFKVAVNRIDTLRTYANAMRPHLCTHTVRGMHEDINKNNTPWDRMKERMKERMNDNTRTVSTYLRAWYKGKKRLPHRTR
jgi:hypothetical protein